MSASIVESPVKILENFPMDFRSYSFQCVLDPHRKSAFYDALATKVALLYVFTIRASISARKSRGGLQNLTLSTEATNVISTKLKRYVLGRLMDGEQVDFEIDRTPRGDLRSLLRSSHAPAYYGIAKAGVDLNFESYAGRDIFFLPDSHLTIYPNVLDTRVGRYLEGVTIELTCPSS